VVRTHLTAAAYQACQGFTGRFSVFGGWATIATLDLQSDALKRAKCREIYEEQACRKKTSRPQLEGRFKSLRGGDTLVVWRLDRLGRNLADLVRLIADLEQRKINFESLTEKIETASPAGRLVFHVFAALAEFERNLIRERTVAGLKAARARGVYSSLILLHPLIATEPSVALLYEEHSSCGFLCNS